MRFRCIVFLPLAAWVTGLLFLLSLSMVSILEENFMLNRPIEVVAIAQYETECEFLERRIEKVEREFRFCEALPGCLESQNICPLAMQEEHAADYRRLRDRTRSHCAKRAIQVMHVSATCPGDSEDCGVEHCSLPESGVRAGSTLSRPGVFLF